MRILHITPAYEPAWHLGGVLRSVSQLCRGSVRLGHDVTVFTTDSGFDQRMDVPVNQEVDIDGVKVFYFKTDYTLKYYYSNALRKACQNAVREFDLVHLSSPFAYPSVAAGMAARKAKVPFIISSHGRFIIKYNPRKFLKKWLYFQLVRGRDFRKASAIHYTTELEREESCSLGHKVDSFVVSNGVDATEFDGLPTKDMARTALGFAGEDLIVLYFGRLEPRKALDLLIKGFARGVKGSGIQAKLVLAGPDFGVQAELEDLSEKLGIAHQVLFPGYIHPEKRNLLLAAADLMALVSHPGENFGISALEGMLAGLPVLLSNNVGFSREVMPYGVGREVTLEEESIAQGLQRMLSDPPKLKAMGRVAAEVAKSRYDINIVVPKMLQAYEDVLSGRRSPELLWSAG